MPRRTDLLYPLGRATRIAVAVLTHFTPMVARSVVGAALWRPEPADAWARPLRRTFEDLGTTFVFGQLVESWSRRSRASGCRSARSWTCTTRPGR